jgi:hypothetical protein
MTDHVENVRAYLSSIEAKHGAALRAVTRGPIRRRRKSLGSQLGAVLLWLLWRLRFLFLLAGVAAGVIHFQTGTEEAHCYATNVYHKGPTGWRMVMHHASAAPEQTGLLDSHDTPGLLH